MKITIENTSSPGASFTDNTNDVLLKTYQWIQEHPDKSCSYHDFRKAIERDKKINDNNNRNIHPLLKNCGLVSYETRGNITVNKFFTKSGLAYVKVLETINMVENNNDYTLDQKKTAKKKLECILQELVYSSLTVLFKKTDLNYLDPLKEFLAFALYFGKIDKAEFAYYLSEKKEGLDVSNLSNLKSTIDSYRNGVLQFEVDVSVRNDIDLRESSKKDRRKEGLSYLTSFTYFSSLLLQSGILKKDKDYFVINETMREKAKSLLEG